MQTDSTSAGVVTAQLRLRRAIAALQQEGTVRALYRGTVPALWKASVSAAVTFGTYEAVKSRLALATAS
jgi:Mitochondrial carrier protein